MSITDETAITLLYEEHIEEQYFAKEQTIPNLSGPSSSQPSHSPEPIIPHTSSNKRNRDLLTHSSSTTSQLSTSQQSSVKCTTDDQPKQAHLRQWTCLGTSRSQNYSFGPSETWEFLRDLLTSSQLRYPSPPSKPKNTTKTVTIDIADIVPNWTILARSTGHMHEENDKRSIIGVLHSLGLCMSYMMNWEHFKRHWQQLRWSKVNTLIHPQA